MEKRWMALVALSAAVVTAFVGCSCGNKVNNSIDDSNQIEVQSDVTVSSEITTATTTEASAAETTASSETTTAETTESSETGTTVSRRVQFVGQAGGGRATTTAKPVVVTVVVTVTNAPVQTTTATVPPTEAPIVTTTTLVTMNMPDGLFTPEQDLCFTIDGNAMAVGDVQPALSTLAEQIMNGTPVNGGTAAYTYSCDGYRVNTEVMAMADGSAQEQITEIVLTGDNVCTNKGVKAGDPIDTVLAAYGSADCEIVDTYIYRYKTEDGYVMDFVTDGASVTQIQYYKSAE